MSAWDWMTRFGVVPANWPKATRSRYVPQGKSLKDLASASPLPTRRGEFWHSKALTGRISDDETRRSVGGRSADRNGRYRSRAAGWHAPFGRSEGHRSELQLLIRNSYAVFCLYTTKKHKTKTDSHN